MRMLPSETTRPHSPTLYLGGLSPGNPSAHRHRTRSTRGLVVYVGSDHGVCHSVRRGLKPSLLTSDGTQYRVEDGTRETGNEPSERILTDPAAREGAREPDHLPRLCTRAEHTEHNRDTPSAETRPVDATTVPIVGATCCVDETCRVIPFAANHVDQKDTTPRAQRHGEQGEEGGERAVEVPGDDGDVEGAGEEGEKGGEGVVEVLGDDGDVESADRDKHGINSYRRGARHPDSARDQVPSLQLNLQITSLP